MSFLKMEAHTGTHVDAPAHFSQYHMTEEEGVRIDKVRGAVVCCGPPQMQGIFLTKDCVNDFRVIMLNAIHSPH